MSRAPTEHDSPSMFAGLQEAPLSPFFKAIANTLGEGTPKKACGMFVERVKREYLHTTLGAFFDLEMSQVEVLLEERQKARARAVTVDPAGRDGGTVGDGGVSDMAW